MADLTTLADVKAWLDIPLASTTADTLLTRLITAASDFIETTINRVLSSAQYTDVRNGPGGYSLVLSEYPVTAVASVTVDDISIPQSTSASMPGYVLDGDRLVLRGGLRFTAGVANVVVVFTAGYVAIPAAIAQACIELVSIRYKERDRIGLVSKVLAGETVSYSQKDVPADVQTMLNQLKKVVPL